MGTRDLREQTEQGAENEGDVGYSHPVDASEDLGRLIFESESVKRSRSDVEIRIGG